MRLTLRTHQKMRFHKADFWLKKWCKKKKMCLRNKCIRFKLNISTLKFKKYVYLICQSSMSLRNANLSRFVILKKKNCCCICFAFFNTSALQQQFFF